MHVRQLLGFNILEEIILFLIWYLCYLVVFAAEELRNSGEEISPPRHSSVKLNTMPDDLLQFDSFSIKDLNVDGSLVASALSLLIEKEVKKPVS